jgi:hypothetical protein
MSKSHVERTKRRGLYTISDRMKCKFRQVLLLNGRLNGAGGASPFSLAPMETSLTVSLRLYKAKYGACRLVRIWGELPGAYWAIFATVRIHAEDTLALHVAYLTFPWCGATPPPPARCASAGLRQYPCAHAHMPTCRTPLATEPAEISHHLRLAPLTHFGNTCHMWNIARWFLVSGSLDLCSAQLWCNGLVS